MASKFEMNILELTMCLSDAVDLINEAVTNHHRQVSYIAYSIGKALGLSAKEQNDLLLAGALHDIGALSLKERLNALHFEVDHPHEHAVAGYRLLNMYHPFCEIAAIIRMHHVPWKNGAGLEYLGVEVPIASHVLHLADRVAVSIIRNQEILSQVESICEAIGARSGTLFMPEAVEAFMELAGKESFWFDSVSKSVGPLLLDKLDLPRISVTLDETLGLAELFSHIIDFRSRFTATHSSGIAAGSEALAHLAGYPTDECKMMRIAGYLHDLGKLAVPVEILEKPAPLTRDEFRVVKKHSYLTYRILEKVEALSTINTWAALHHERLDGNGYPFRLKAKDLPEGSRIMAVTDVFTAITEDRPYRLGMNDERALQVLQKMVLESALDGDIVALLREHFDEINDVRIKAQESARNKYQEFEDTLIKCA